ncbi:uncharacterized protein si:ch1073-126c3.2 isoform X1 [Hippoglossus hippoglossus]|uniref:uncharacterized protein si:ch1073-126c3.2 isoform X1 n=1 Tax=Hippoglossus hippoglossus TaxID=8267 RepID=UPI00148BA5F5|nr:uncharacterized protein si:ch1073-126c3.2 isoform X1 [Hippoglossus hippoglossus]
MEPNSTSTWMFLLAAVSVFAAVSVSEPSDDTFKNCTSQTQLFERLSADLKEAAESGENLPSTWSSQQSARLLVSTRYLKDLLHKHQLKDCQLAEPKECPAARVPENGGLVCVTVNHTRYCKPLCNYGYDFGFLRRSRLFEECSNQTRFKWGTQYIGGNRLAVCNVALTQISGAQSAYFPKDRDCLTTKSQLQNSFIQSAVAELQSKGIEGDAHEACLVCG